MVVFIYDVPLWVSGPVLVAGLAGFSLVALAVVRRCIMPRLSMQPHEVEYPATMIQSGMVFYALVATLVAITVWERPRQVSDQVSDEAAAIATVWRDLGGYPSPQREAMRDLLQDYSGYLIETTWPQQRKGILPRGEVAFMNRMQEQLFAFEPASESQKILHAETLRAYQQMIQTKRLRVEAVGSGLPAAMWALVLSGALVSMIVSLFFPIQDARLQALLVASLACFVALVIFVILALDQPFRGDLGIEPTMLRLVHDVLMAR